MNINFVVVVVSFQRVTFTFQLHVNPRMLKIKKMPSKTAWRPKKEQKRTKKNKKTETGTTKNVF